MKTIIIIVIISFVSLTLVAQDNRPQKTPSFVTVNWKSSKYEQLQEEWHKYIVKHKKDANAWENYYLAAHGKYRTSLYYNDSITIGSQAELDEIMVEMEQAIPNTYEYNKTMYRNHNLDPQYGKYIEKAYELNPNSLELYPTLITYYETICDGAKRDLVFKKWYNQDVNLPNIKLSFGYNALQTFEQNAIVLANGDDAVYPIGIVQNGLGIRSDVRIVAQSLFQMDAYYSTLLNDLNMPAFNKSTIDFMNENIKNKALAFQQLNIERIKHIISNAGDRPVYFPTQLDPYLFSYFEDSLYLVGTHYIYSSKSMDNIAILKYNFEKKYLLDSYKIDVNQRTDAFIKANFQRVYVQGLVELFKHFQLSGDIQKANDYKAMILVYAEQIDQYENYLKYLNNMQENHN